MRKRPVINQPIKKYLALPRTLHSMMEFGKEYNYDLDEILDRWNSNPKLLLSHYEFALDEGKSLRAAFNHRPIKGL